MNVFRMIVRALIVGVLILAATSCASVQMPKMDAAKAIEGPHPIAYCSQTSGIYSQDYDLNPKTQAAARVYGWFDADRGEPKLEDPVVVILQDDAGKPAGVFVHEHGKAVQYPDMKAVVAKYPEPCNLPRRTVAI